MLRVRQRQQVPGAGDDVLGVREEQLPELRDAHVAVRALEQFPAEPPLEVLDPPAEQRLGDVKLLRRCREALPFRDRGERLEVRQQVHS